MQSRRQVLSPVLPLALDTCCVFLGGEVGYIETA